MQPPKLIRPSQEQGLPTPPMTNGLPEHRAKQVEAGLATFQSVIAERDQLDQKLRAAILKIEGLDVQLGALQGVINMMESTYLSSKLDLETRLKQYQTERDEAVARAASLETILSSIQTLIFSKIPDAAA
jgi:hypothetical protein